MPRPSYLHNVRTGILTIPDAARLSGISLNEMRALVAEKKIPFFPIGKSSEPRVPAGPLLRFCKERGLPISATFAQSARTYEERYINPADLRQENLTLPHTSPSINTEPIYATASGPASFIPEEQPVNEMTPYQSAQFAPHPELLPENLSNGNQAGTEPVRPDDSTPSGRSDGGDR